MSDFDELEDDGFGVEKSTKNYGRHRRDMKVRCQGKLSSGVQCSVRKPTGRMHWVERVPFCHWHAPE